MKPYADQKDNKPIFNEGVTPIGKIVHLYHDRPQMKTSDQFGKVPKIDPKTGIQEAEFKATLAWPKTHEHLLMPMLEQATLTKHQAWPSTRDPGSFFALQPFFRDGDNPEHNTEGRDYLKGHYYMNFKKKAKAVKDSFGNVVYEGNPGLLGPMGPGDLIMYSDLWQGCTGRVSYTMFGTEYMGKHFITVRLQNIQKAADGERMGGGGTPSPDKQFGAIGGVNPGPAGANPFGSIAGAVQQGLQNAFSQPVQANPFGQPSGAGNPFGGQPQGNPFGNPNPFGQPSGGGRMF